MSTDDLLARYHELVDAHLLGSIGVVESVELGVIDFRLNALDADHAEMQWVFAAMADEQRGYL